MSDATASWPGVSSGVDAGIEVITGDAGGSAISSIFAWPSDGSAWSWPSDHSNIPVSKP